MKKKGANDNKRTDLYGKKCTLDAITYSKCNFNSVFIPWQFSLANGHTNKSILIFIIRMSYLHANNTNFHTKMNIFAHEVKAEFSNKYVIFFLSGMERASVLNWLFWRQ